MKKLCSFLIFISFSIFSCEGKIDLCENTICFNGGRCLAGICLCETGYTGINCKEKINSGNNVGNSGNSGNSGNTSNCFSTPYYGSQNNCNVGYVTVSPLYCCPSLFPYYGIEKAGCYATCDAARSDGNSTIVFGTGQTSSSSGSNGNSGSGNIQYGSVMLWIDEDHQCGNITVTFNSRTATISSYYFSVPNCGSSGCANFENLIPGTYTYSAKCSGYTWGPSSIRIEAGSCHKIRLD